MAVKKVQQSVPAGVVPAVEPPVRPPSPWVPPARSRPAASAPPPALAEDPVEYPSGDGLPIATNTDHLEWMDRCCGDRTLKHRCRGRRDLFVGVDMLIYYERGNNEARVAPDVFVSFGVPPRERPSYFVWQEGKPPDVVWEFGAPLTIKGDAAQKKETYREMGVREYWLADPVGGVYAPRLQGFALVDGVYEPTAVGGGAGRLGGGVESGVAVGVAFRGRATGVLGPRDSAVSRAAGRGERAALAEERRPPSPCVPRGRLEERRGRLEGAGPAGGGAAAGRGAAGLAGGAAGPAGGGAAAGRGAAGPAGGGAVAPKTRAGT